jgi:O-antigen biosynthesis protein
VLRSTSHSVYANFAQFLARKFGQGPFVVIGQLRPNLEREFLEAGLRLVSQPPVESEGATNGTETRAEVAIWFYSPAQQLDENAVKKIASQIREVLLIAEPGAEAIKRRPGLVECFQHVGFSPDYACDLGDFDSTALLLVRKTAGSAETLVSEVETAFERLNQKVCSLERTLGTRVSELEAADRHISRLEEKLLKLKEAQRAVKQLKQEKQSLRKSPERKIGQVVLAPYRLPQKLIRGVKKRLPGAGREAPLANEYQEWFEKHRVKQDQIGALQSEDDRFAYRPLISIVTPVFDTPAVWLKECVDSVLAQIYRNWQLVLVDDQSTRPETIQALVEIATRDPRIILTKTSERGGISAASNCGLAIAQGEWVAFLDHDDILEPDALFQNVKRLQDQPETDLIYSDEDKLTDQGFDLPSFKPDWSPDFFLSYNYICHFAIARRDLINNVGGFRSEFDGAQDYDLWLRVSEQTERIEHIPRVLYHWRRSATSTADNIRRKPGSLEAGRLALEGHLQRKQARGHVTVDWRTHAYWVKRELVEAKKISIIIPVRDRIDLLTSCLDSLTTKTNYPSYEIVLVDNDSQTAEARDYFRRTQQRVLRFHGPFNYSAINNLAVEQTDSPWLLFLNDDTEVIEGDWLTLMAQHIQRPEVGAVGPRLLYPNDTVQHAGIVVGVGGIAGHAFSGLPAEAPGVGRQLQTTRNYSAVTGACLLTRRDVFSEVGGFDEKQLPVTFNDVDLCLKMRQAGYRIVYVPFATLYHHESATRRPGAEPRETEVMQKRWGNVLARDPYYNPNLSRAQADFSLGK